MQTHRLTSPFSLSNSLCNHCLRRTLHLNHRTKAQRQSLARQDTLKALSERSNLLRTRVHASRKARREDFYLGPLAPDRFALAPNGDHGCVEIAELQGVKGLGFTRRGRSPYMEKDIPWEESLIQEGDRVVVVAEEGAAGRERGKVGRVKEVRKEERECIVEDINMVEIRIPPYMLAMDPSSPPILSEPLPLPLSAVRLIHPLRIPAQLSPSGVLQPPYYQDCIIQSLVRRPGHKGRWIANSERALGQWVRVPKNPHAPPTEEEEKKDHDIDTLRYQAEDETWTPTLLRAPMPAGVIDELRGKYSRFRTRHDPGYLEAKETKKLEREAYEQWAKSGGGMLTTPAKEARAREVYELKQRGKPELTESVLEKIGELMARKGVRMTDGRRRELERNLEGEEVLRGVSRVGEREEKESEEDDFETAEGELESAMERMGVDEVVVEDGEVSRRDESRP
ncbi:hypothetical protein ACLMJK_007098 [Lecanora helva]